MFSGAYGQPFTVARFNQRNLFQHIPALHGSDPLAIYLTVGDDDGFGLHRGSIALILALEDAGVPVEMCITDGDHNWRLWRRSITDVLLFFAGILKTKGKPPPTVSSQ